jgi:hypothetical protein
LEGLPELLPHEGGIDGIVEEERRPFSTVTRRSAQGIPDVSRCGELNGELGLCVVLSACETRRQRPLHLVILDAAKCQRGADDPMSEKFRDTGAEVYVAEA